jgi:hypothetical protein
MYVLAREEMQNLNFQKLEDSFTLQILWQILLFTVGSGTYGYGSQYYGQ